MKTSFPLFTTLFLWVSFPSSAFLSKRDIMARRSFSFGLQASNICPELPLSPQTKGNEVAIVACG